MLSDRIEMVLMENKVCELIELLQSKLIHSTCFVMDS